MKYLMLKLDYYFYINSVRSTVKSELSKIMSIDKTKNKI